MVSMHKKETRHSIRRKFHPISTSAEHKRNGRTYFERFLQVLSAPVKEHKGKKVGTVALDSNVAALTRLEAKIHKEANKQKLLRQKAALLKQQNTELRALNHSKDEFIALASHQLRTPATGVKQYVGMVLEGYAGAITAEQRTFLERAYESNERQLSTINDLLQIAQIDANKFELAKQPTDLLELITSIKRDQQTVLEGRQQQLTVKTMSKSTEAYVDKQRIRMALENLIDNAGKYSQEHTTITVTLRQNENLTEITVQDQGVGIAEQDFGKLFQKFSRIDNPVSIAVGGNGLGLYVAKKIIDAHKGFITIDSMPGKGTTFTITLPTNSNEV